MIINGYYIKNLYKIKNRDIKKMIILDNSILSFYLTINNGIYIPTFKGNHDDNYLNVIC